MWGQCHVWGQCVGAVCEGGVWGQCVGAVCGGGERGRCVGAVCGGGVWGQCVGWGQCAGAVCGVGAVCGESVRGQRGLAVSRNITCDTKLLYCLTGGGPRRLFVGNGGGARRCTHSS